MGGGGGVRVPNQPREWEMGVVVEQPPRDGVVHPRRWVVRSGHCVA